MSSTGPENFREIVGVVGDVKQQGLVRGSSPHVYEPFSQAPDRFMTLIVRSSNDPTALVPAIRSKVIELDPELPLQRVSTLDTDYLQFNQAATFYLGCAFGVRGGGARARCWRDFTESFRIRWPSERESLVFVSRSARRSSDVLRLVFKQGMTFVLLGEVVGILGAYALTGLIQGLLFGVTATDKVTFITVAVSLFLVALVACYVPARRATKVDPL